MTILTALKKWNSDFNFKKIQKAYWNNLLYFYKNDSWSMFLIIAILYKQTYVKKKKTLANLNSCSHTDWDSALSEAFKSKPGSSRQTITTSVQYTKSYIFVFSYSFSPTSWYVALFSARNVTINNYIFNCFITRLLTKM